VSAPKAAVDAEMQAFASTLRKRGPRCWMCSLPKDVRKRIESARAADPITWTHQALADFMREKLGLEQATYARVRDHLRTHVERPHAA
jgi:hypothetical protein